MNAEELKKPKSHKAEVLYHLLVYKQVSCKDFPWMSGFRTRISDLKLENSLPIDTKMHHGISKYKNVYKYAVHKLKCDLEQAIKIYNIING